MADSIPAPAPGAETSPHRIKRNTACISCRDSKVKCNASTAAGQPCLRCTKLHLQCVVDKSHKRVSRRSKLEELVQEVQSIKEAVGSKTPTAVPQIPLPQLTIPSLRDAPPISPAASFQARPLRPVSSGPLSEPRAITPALTAQTTPSTSGKTSEPRALKSQVFSGQDIDYYFDKYFDYFHPYLPVVRTRDPDACYKSSPLLFWTIIAAACRRYPRDDIAFPFLVDTLQSEVWRNVSEPPISLATINALLLLCAWPLSSVRLMKDPSLTYSGICMNACFMLGLHTGRGNHPEFCYQSYPVNVTNEEAVYTWTAYNIISQSVRSYCGLPPHGQPFSSTIDAILNGTCGVRIPTWYAVQLELARFSHRVSRMISATLEEFPGVSHHLVATLEEELTRAQPLFSNEMADEVVFFFMLLARLDVQMYFLLPSPGCPPELLKRNVLRAFDTARNVTQLALKLDREQSLLRHAPHYVFRYVLSATSVLMTVFLSPYMSEFSTAEAQALMTEAITALTAFSLQEGDLPMRVSKMYEQTWMARHLLPQRDLSHPSFTPFSCRLGMSLTLGCLRRWKEEIIAVRPAPAPGLGETGAQPPVDTTADPTLSGAGLAQIDWSVFMDDFDWTFDPEFLTVQT